MSLSLDPENEQVIQFLYKIALVYANNYPTPSLYECTTKIKHAKNIIIPDGASLGFLVLRKGLEYMHEKTELVAPESFRYVIAFNANLSEIANTINIPPKIDLNKNYVIMLHIEGDRIAVDMGNLDDKTRDRIIDEICYRPSPFR